MLKLNKKDGWSVGGIQTNLSDSLIAMNFENGAHHSELNHVGPNYRDSDDIKKGYIAISHLIGTWITEVRHEVQSGIAVTE